MFSYCWLVFFFASALLVVKVKANLMIMIQKNLTMEFYGAGVLSGRFGGRVLLQAGGGGAGGSAGGVVGRGGGIGGGGELVV